MRSREVQPEGKIFGERLRDIRQKRGATQTGLAEAAGMSLTYINNMEHGLKVPSLTTILRLAVALDCKVMDLVGVFDQKNIAKLIPK